MLQLAPMGKLRKLLWLNGFSHIALFVPLYKADGQIEVVKVDTIHAREDFNLYRPLAAVGVITAGNHAACPARLYKCWTIKF